MVLLEETNMEDVMDESTLGSCKRYSTTSMPSLSWKDTA
jgi:hypothetical protein